MSLLLMLIPVTMKKSLAYTMSLVEIQRHPEIIELLGEPIDPGFLLTGSISTNISDGNASIQYSLNGSKGKGKAYVVAYKKFGDWNFEEVVVDIPYANKRILVVPSN